MFNSWRKNFYTRIASKNGRLYSLSKINRNDILSQEKSICISLLYQKQAVYYIFFLKYV
jgi:hypothetical protein